MKAELYYQVRCPKCDFVMLRDKIGIKCINEGCKIFNIYFEAPSVELIKIQQVSPAEQA